jgi:hypothetical protein
VEVTYLTAGVNWRADYTAVLADDEKTIDLNGWVTVDNRSGTGYEDAKLKLVAGDIHRAPTPGYVVEKQMVYDMAEAAAPPQVEERAFFEYHLYEVQRPVIGPQTKQIEFVTGSDIPVQRYLSTTGADPFGGYHQPIDDPTHGTASNVVQVMLEFKNGEEEGLRANAVQGRAYKDDVDGSTLLIGEDAIDHTPKDEQVRLYVGDAFDIVGERCRPTSR